MLLTYHSKQAEAEAVVDEIRSQGRRAAALRLDVGAAGSFDAFLGEVSATLRDTFQAEQFHFLVNNAGTGVYAAFADTAETQFDEMVNVHLKDLNAHLAAATALGRVGRPDDIGGIVAFLCSDEARWVNAQRIEASGGVNL